VFVVKDGHFWWCFQAISWLGTNMYSLLDFISTHRVEKTGTVGSMTRVEKLEQ
jgi:hypothetical protein